MPGQPRFRTLRRYQVEQRERNIESRLPHRLCRDLAGDFGGSCFGRAARQFVHQAHPPLADHPFGRFQHRIEDCLPPAPLSPRTGLNV